MDIKNTQFSTSFPLSKRGWRLMKQSSSLLTEHPKLLLLSFIARAIHYALFSGVLILALYLVANDVDLNNYLWWQITLFYLAALCVFFIANFSSVLVQAILSVCVMQYQQNKHPKITQGLAAACRRFWPLFLWLLFYSTVGLFIIRPFQKKLNQTQWMQRWLHGMDFYYANYLVNPVIMHQACGPIAAISQSSQLMNRYAGINPKRNYSFTLLAIAIRLIAAIPLFIGLYLGETHLIITGSGISILCFLLIGTWLSATEVTLRNAIYEYITTQKIPLYFNEQDLKQAFIKRN